MNKRILTTVEELKIVLSDVLKEHENRVKSQSPPKLYTINRVAKMTHVSHSTIKKKVQDGVIQATKDGLISEEALNDYLKINI